MWMAGKLPGEEPGEYGSARKSGDSHNAWVQQRRIEPRGNIMDKARKVLVVDDEEIVRVSHMRSLAGQNCKVEAAQGGEQALENMQKEAADVILMDLRMPGIDGLATLKAIKEKWPDTEVVIITGYPSVFTAREAHRLGAFDYLVKPVDPDKVLAVANQAMAQRLAPPPGEKGAQGKDPQKGWAKYLD
jgi:DNA-binding NtrC family response regulator